jgi:hypothetical protein
MKRSWWKCNESKSKPKCNTPSVVMFIITAMGISNTTLLVSLHDKIQQYCTCPTTGVCLANDILLQILNPLMLELNPSAQCYLMRFFTRDFAS